MEIGKAFTYVFEDPNWVKKVLIGGVLLLVPIFGPLAVYGYTLTTLKNVAEGQPTPMPEWTDFGALFMKGLYAMVGALIYFVPLLVLACCAWLMLVLGGGGAVAASSSSQGNGGGILATLALVGLWCFGCLAGLYGLVAGLSFYAPLTRFAMSANQLSIFWDFKGNMDFVRNNLTNYIIALLIGLVAGFIAEFGLILCVVGVLFTAFWAQLVYAYMFGQLWRNQGQAKAPAMA